jgi:hypothetical protein
VKFLLSKALVPHLMVKVKGRGMKTFPIFVSHVAVWGMQQQIVKKAN